MQYLADVTMATKTVGQKRPEGVAGFRYKGSMNIF
jgi:hypothetical protein